MGRPRKYNVDAHQTQIIALYSEGWTSKQVTERIEQEHGVKIPHRTLQRRLGDWGVFKHMPIRAGDELKPRIQSFWELGLSDEDMLNILQSEGYRASLSTITRLRYEMNLLRKAPGGDHYNAALEPAAPNAEATTVSIDDRDTPSAQVLPRATRSSPRRLVVSSDSESEESVEGISPPRNPPSRNPARPWENPTPAGTDSLAHQISKLTGVPPVKGSKPVARQQATTSPERPKRKSTKRKRAVQSEDEESDLPEAAKAELQRVKDENTEIRQLMEALREEADESKAKMLDKAKDDAEKYSRIKQLESQLEASNLANTRLMASASADERVVQVTITKNAEIERVKIQLADARATFRNASVRVFKYQRNCAAFLAGLRRNDPNYSTETTEAEMLTEELEKCFTAEELKSIREQL